MQRFNLLGRPCAADSFRTATRARRIAVAWSGLITVVVTIAGEATAATFAPIAGSLFVRAGNLAPQSAAVAFPTKALDVNTFPDGFNRAVATFAGGIVGTSRFNYSATATSVTSVMSSDGSALAVSSLSFQQGLTTTGPQWIEVAGNVLSPGTSSASGTLQFLKNGQPFPIYAFGDTAGTTVTQNGLYAAGSYTLQGALNTSVTAPGAPSAALSGSLLVASLGDFNNDGVVGAGDVPTIKNNFGSSAGTFATGNLDGDADTDGADFLLLQRQLGTHTLAVAPATAAVPEPVSAALAVLAALVVFAASAYSRTCRSAARRAFSSPAI